MKNWLYNRRKLEEVEGIFSSLINSNMDMGALISDNGVTKIDQFINEVEQDESEAHK